MLTNQLKTSAALFDTLRYESKPNAQIVATEYTGIPRLVHFANIFGADLH